MGLTHFVPAKNQQEKDELTAVIQEMKEDAETLNEKFAEQQQEQSRTGSDYQAGLTSARV